ncbi:NUDIX domain-containing protein [bacterium]|nr:NUDIX domain-containing protein [bacterium]MBP3846120.1 NUDIX domain-containing protein [bacterium]
MKYCIECGTKLILKENFNCGVSEGMVPFCPDCNEFRFPQFNTSVSMVVFNKDYSKILLIQQYGRGLNILVAGYVTKGECLEQTLKRELKEEVNLDLLSFRYNASNYFEKTNSLICNFIVQTQNEDFKLNPEVDYAQWYSIEQAKEVIYKNSLAQDFLLQAIEKIR